ncbi:cytochrome P450 [Microbacterium sp. APC 3898]|uniref:Cytochrome P450 n=1 Tax=Planococcus notacanthi TaxID=3035188 RepID=A0ABT7ZHP8_9BACL|nr:MULTISPECIES: cytochrome P450 [Terrabacteria group]MDN3426641.1 cytochrome P450 [Planococcus sp. APC 4016]MDN3437900.1 cytochrome P450 [Planococcus sp. APC 3900]MDN3500395.1 cytochrome P450 [Microbacterium sp. APC 3898]
MNDSNHVTPEQAIVGLLSGKSRENPFVVFEQIRQTGSVVQLPFPMGETNNKAWVVTHMEEALKVLKDQEHFCVDPTSIDKNSTIKQSLTGSSDSTGSDMFLTNSLNAIDQPDHRRLRTLVSKAFTPRYMEGLRPRIQELADELLDQVQDQGEMDLVKNYANLLPINVISDMIGVPKSDHSLIHKWSEGIANGLGVGTVDPKTAENLKDFGDYIKQLTADKRKQPSDDLISQLISIEEQGDRLDEEELISLVQLMIFAGHETTSTLISTGTLLLLDHPEQLEMLKADPNLIPGAVEELLRYHGPSTTAGPRYALKDLELKGQQIKKGDMIFPLLKAANRDEQQFERAEELDVTRTIKRHLAFGQGVHMCLGAPLARVEGTIAFATLFKRMPNLQLSIPREDVSWKFKLAAQSLSSLPVKF